MCSIYLSIYILYVGLFLYILQMCIYYTRIGVSNLGEPTFHWFSTRMKHEKTGGFEEARHAQATDVKTYLSFESFRPYQTNDPHLHDLN